MHSVISSMSVFPMDFESAGEAGLIFAARKKGGRPMDPEDAMIAGIVKLNHETVLTRNTGHFSRIEGVCALRVINMQVLSVLGFEAVPVCLPVACSPVEFRFCLNSCFRFHHVVQEPFHQGAQSYPLLFQTASHYIFQFICFTASCVHCFTFLMFGSEDTRS